MTNGWAVILGASVGTGAAIARTVARAPGLDVFGMHRGHHVEEAASVERDVVALGRRMVTRVGEAGTAEAAKLGAQALLEAAGPKSVKLFVHSLANASLGHLVPKVGRALVPKQFEKTLESMAHSFVYWVQEMVARDLLAPSARILGLTNPLHDTLLHNTSLVAASKAALEIYVRHLAFELGPRGYRVNLLKFPTIITAAVKKTLSPDALERLTSAHEPMIPAGRMCTAEEVARFVSVLAGDDAEWFNGATIDFTGGMTQFLLDLILNPRGGAA